ncbi:SDR family oxidoreductase [Pseudomonas aeruginosa]|uniref:SDR family oxidoreductase n=1 Tax=Pseudomonas aeruginosa TaxID=287 RepID=UPI0011B64281|nr:NmrA family NAD(P)-binding protein [Pseudomonas aeruginosa]EKV6491988.1 NmrA family NAD(P)-binding protein [Pseudomonas aeruginosa]TWW48441.1 NAD-dependent epimerase/dehydratase family protein [Pseudomonas aeruginosa]TWY05413.1 NAD-dependent epimerase/dehydratase family protein [Pseudomonas aeruginosa]
MAVLVTGSTGTVGSEVVRQLVALGEEVFALTRDVDKTSFPEGVIPVNGSLSQPLVLRDVLKKVRGLFLMSPVVSDELTGTLTALSLASAEGVKDVVYLSALEAHKFTDIPHFAAKASAERMIRDKGISATILQPGYFMQNDGSEKKQIFDLGVYFPPIGNRETGSGVLAVDVRDLGEIAAKELIRRMNSDGRLPNRTLAVAAPGSFTGEDAAEIWSSAINRKVKYNGDDLDSFELYLRRFLSDDLAFDIRIMMYNFRVYGMKMPEGSSSLLHDLLGRPMKTYREYVEEVSLIWSKEIGFD